MRWLHGTELRVGQGTLGWLYPPHPPSEAMSARPLCKEGFVGHFIVTTPAARFLLPTVYHNLLLLPSPSLFLLFLFSFSVLEIKPRASITTPLKFALS